MFYHPVRARISSAGALTRGFANRRAHTYASFSPRSRHTTDVLFFPLLRPPIAASAVQISSRWGGPGRYFQVFLRRRFARYVPLSQCLCPTGFATALRPCSSGISRKNVILAHVSLYDHLRIRLPRIDRREWSR